MACTDRREPHELHVMKLAMLALVKSGRWKNTH